MRRLKASKVPIASHHLTRVDRVKAAATATKKKKIMTRKKILRIKGKKRMTNGKMQVKTKTDSDQKIGEH